MGGATGPKDCGINETVAVMLTIRILDKCVGWYVDRLIMPFNCI